MKLLFTMFFLLLFYGTCLAQFPNSVICEFERIAIAELTKDTTLETFAEGSKGTITIGNLNSKHPIATGNVYTTKLQILRKTADAIWLAEYPEGDGVHVITLFFKTGVVMYAKQYTLVGKPFGCVEIGKFKPMS